MNGFNPDQLVARGVFDSVEELDRVMLELDEARKEPRVISCAWLEGMGFQPRIDTDSHGFSELPHTRKGVAATAKGGDNEKGISLHALTEDAAQVRTFAGQGEIATRPTSKTAASKHRLTRPGAAKTGYEVADDSCRVPLPTNLPAACAVGAGRAGNDSPSGLAAARVAEAGSGVANTSRRSPELLSEPASVLCPWCAVERAMSGQGTAARTGFVSVERCHRHSAEPPALTVAAPKSPMTAGARDAFFLAPAAALQSLRSADAGPFHPTTNPNAGVVPAYPKGRW